MNMKIMNLIKKSSHAGKILGGVLLAIGASTASSHANLDISDISSGNLSTTFGAAHTSDLNWVQVFNSGGAGNLGDISGLSMYLRNSSSSTAHVTVSIATYNPIANSYSSAIALGTMSIPGMTTQVNPVALADATYMLTGGTDYALEFTSVANMDIPLTTTGNAPTVTSGVTPDASLVGFGIVSSPPPYSGYQMGFEVDFTPVPEPSTYITGALMMMPLGAGLLGKLRKKQSA
jgi:hypothetical protein